MRGLILGAVLALAMTGAALARHGGRGGEHVEGGEGNKGGNKVEQGEQQRQPVPDQNQPRGNSCSSPGGAASCGLPI